MTALPYEFRWAKDRTGYRTEFDDKANVMTVQARGGPPHHYEPFREYPGLWRKLADCVDDRGVADHDKLLGFVTDYGLPGAKPPPPWWERNEASLPAPVPDDSELLPVIGYCAEALHRVAQHIDTGDLATAAQVWRDAKPDLTADIQPGVGGNLEPRFIPKDLYGVVMLQAMDTIVGNLKWRRCRNQGCPEWFMVGGAAKNRKGAIAKTLRREFCSDRCRMAASRRRAKSA